MMCCQGHIGIRNDSFLTCLHAVRSRQLGGERCCSSGMSYGFLKEASICRIEATLDVSFDEPFGTVPCVMDFCHSRLASPFRSETMAVVRKLWLIVGFQDGTDYILNH